MKDVERFIIELRPEPPGRDNFGRDPWYRLRGLLKVALRRFGLRCVRVDVKHGAPAGLATEKLSPPSDGCSGLHDRAPAALYKRADKGKG